MAQGAPFRRLRRRFGRIDRLQLGQLVGRLESLGVATVKAFLLHAREASQPANQICALAREHDFLGIGSH